MKGALNEHFKQLKSFRANKSAENALRFAAETKTMARLLERHPELLTAEVFNIIEYHAKTGPSVKGLDMMQRRAKRFPTDTMCEAAIELLSHIATHVPKKRDEAVKTLENVIAISTDYTVRNEALTTLDTLSLRNGKPDPVATAALVRQSKENSHPDIRSDACAYLYATGRLGFEAMQTVKATLGSMLYDQHPVPRNQAIKLLSRSATVSSSNNDLEDISMLFKAAFYRATDPEQKRSLEKAVQGILDVRQKKQDNEDRPGFERALAAIEKLRSPETFTGGDYFYYSWNTVKVRIRLASAEELENIQALAQLTIDCLSKKISYIYPESYERKSCKIAREVLQICAEKAKKPDLQKMKV